MVVSGELNNGREGGGGWQERGYEKMSEEGEKGK